MRLRLIQLPALPSLGVYPTYRLAAAVQELVRRQFLHAKESQSSAARRRPDEANNNGSSGGGGGGSSSSGSSSSRDGSAASHETLLSLLVQPPPPTVIAFTPSPTYTLGRRQAEAQLPAAERARLEAPLVVAGPGEGSTEESDVAAVATTFRPAVVSTLRGGLTTYHGPGQAVLWPVLDLKSPHFQGPGLTVRAYSRLLETTTADVLKRRFGLDAYTTADPGLWVRSPEAGGGGGGPGSPSGKDDPGHPGVERKIAALGVHLRRNISALGVAVNLDTPVTWGAEAAAAATEETNPWARFVPCGLAGRGVSCVADEARLRFGHVPAAWDLRPAPFAAKWAAALAGHLGLRDPDVDVADAATVARLLDEARELLAHEAAAEAAADEQRA